MRSRTITPLGGVLAAGLLLACAGSVEATSRPETAERGFPLIRSYVPDLPQIESQSFEIAHDPRGFLYIANLAGLVVYDGAWWRLLPIGKAQTAFTVASHPDGRIGIGGVDELGYAEAGRDGTLRYVSLLHHLAAGQRRMGQVAQVLPTADGFLFMADEWLVAWDGTTMSTVATFPGGRPFARSFAVGREVYVWTREGLLRLAGRRLAPVPGGEIFRGRRVDMILPAGPAESGLLVSVRGEGLFLFRDGRAVPFAPAASRWAVEHRIYSGCRLADGRWALGSIVGGLLLLRPDGGTDQVIDTDAGLPDNFVGGAVEDHEGSLWLALDSGIARIGVASPLSVIDARAGLEGSVHHVARHQGSLWAATVAGLFRTDGDPGSGPLRMAPVPGGPPSSWFLLPRGDDLLVGTVYGLWVLRGSNLSQVPGTEHETVYVLAGSAADPDRVWLGTSEGLASVRRTGDGWRFEGAVEDVPRDIRSLAEGPGGVLWCGTLGGGLVRVELPGTWPTAPAQVRRIGPDAPAGIFRIGNRLLATAQGQLLWLDAVRARLLADPGLPRLEGWTTYLNLAEDAEGNLWLSTRPPALAVRQDNGWARELRSLPGVTARNVESIVTEPDGSVWLTTERGLYHFTGSFQGAAFTLPAPHLAQVTVGGTPLFGGAPGARPVPAELAPAVRRLRIEIAPLSFRDGLRYQTRLDPLDTGWGAATAEPFAELTRLPPGHYNFRVRTVGPGGETGPETSWTFQVRQAWFQTPWALALWSALAVAAVLGYVRLRSHALVQRAAQLEARVAAQTEELRAANARLEELSLQDELTGIANRRHLRRVLDEEWDRARQSGLPIAFVLFDLDHFKLLNDTRGHLEGDLCLQAVARSLAAAIRRPGELAARYGGEEFAVLLPETGLTAARSFAEQLRQGLEQLALPHPAAPARIVTASFGVAAGIPQPGQPAENLTRAADLALYEAKAGGRNRVGATPV